MAFQIPSFVALLSRRRSLVAVGLALALSSAAPSNTASAQVADGVVEVEVVDGSGGPLPGVLVTVARPDTGLSRTGTSTASGVAIFRSLPPASYEISAALAGFETGTAKGLALRVGQTQRVKLTLRQSKSEEITVTGEVPLVDVYKTDSSTNIVPEQIKDLPVANRNFENLAFIAPGVQRERGAFRFISGGPVVGSGGNASQSSILVNGVDFTDPALGLAKTRISQDAIAEFRVITNRFDSEVGGSAGGALSVVTRSGTNDLKGTVFGFYRSDALRAQGALETGEADFNRTQLGFTVGGPIVKDATHFFVSFEQVNAKNVLPFRPGGAFASTARDVSAPTKQSLGYVGLDQKVGESSRLLARVDLERYREDNFRVGGVVDVSYGQELQRDNLNASLGFVSVLSQNTTNDVRVQGGKRKYFEPTNTNGVAEWFTSGVTLQRGGNILGDLLGEGTFFELRDTLTHQIVTGTASHDIKAGISIQSVKDRSIIDTYATGLLLYAGDVAANPTAFLYGEGSSDVSVKTQRYGIFLQDDFRPVPNVTVSLGVRYDLDTKGNNPDQTYPQSPEPRSKDSNNIQPRLGFSWDLSKDGRFVARGGAGIFTGRYLLVPAFQELSFNGVTGRRLRTRVSLPGLAIDPANPFNTGFLLPSIDLALLDGKVEAPEARQASVGFTARLGNTGLYADVEGIYAKGKKEIVIYDANWRGNAAPGRPNAAFGQINKYGNDGRSEYKALVLSLNGNLKGGHLVTASATFGNKKNISDDFSPEFPTGYPSDPANLEAEYGRARSDERFRFVLSGVFRLPLGFTAGPIFEYGAGQPWTSRYGYDFNGDGKTGDREPGVERFGEDGPAFRQLSLRITKAFNLGPVTLDVIAEAFNLLNTTNYDVTSIDNSKYFSGPTLAAPTRPYVANPNYGNYRATLSPREIQLGARVSF
ncbi:MAG: TonB-dependent receptor [Acidobacteria bacterium]|nr:TonB-dependent receptor [Acidobacteriota bacterium]